MKVLIVGGGGREHALAWKLRRDDPNIELIAAPGNPGIASIARCIPIGVDRLKDLAHLAEEEQVDLTIVGPETPLEAGITNLFHSRGLPIFGPTREAARIETSKRFAKELMVRAGIPTARAVQHSDAREAKAALDDFTSPVVIKASGLAAGKGVIVAQSTVEAERAIDAMLNDRVFGAAGREILIEEFMEGEEISFFAITDGRQALPLLAAQDHKRLHEGDFGPNTGGMGAYAPTSCAKPELVTRVMAEIIRPTLTAMREGGSLFTGLLYAGLMITSDGPKVVEFNCRFGDPETQAILPLMRSSLLDAFVAVASNAGLAGMNAFEWDPAFAVTTVLAARGYPDAPVTGDPITLPETNGGVIAFHAGTSRNREGTLVTSGGRVLSATAVAPTFDVAHGLSADYAANVHFVGKQYRTDIGWRESARRARTT